MPLRIQSSNDRYKRSLFVIKGSLTPLVTTFVVATSLLSPVHALGEEPELVREAEVEVIEKAERRDPRVQGREESLDFFRKLAAGEPPPSEKYTLSSDASAHVAAVYLYCASKNGKCLPVLDAMLHADVLHSRQAELAACPNLTEMWRQWIAYDMEKRQQFLLPMGRGEALTDFNRNERPRYIKCKKSVASLLPLTESKVIEQQQVFRKMYRILEKLSKDAPNIFSALDISR